MIYTVRITAGGNEVVRGPTLYVRNLHKLDWCVHGKWASRPGSLLRKRKVVSGAERGWGRWGDCGADRQHENEPCTLPSFYHPPFPASTSLKLPGTPTSLHKSGHRSGSQAVMDLLCHAIG